MELANSTQSEQPIEIVTEGPWFTELSFYAAIILPVFLIFSLLPSYRSMAPITFVGILAIAIASIRVISYLIGATSDYIDEVNKGKKLDFVYFFESSSPQIGLLVRFLFHICLSSIVFGELN